MSKRGAVALLICGSLIAGSGLGLVALHIILPGNVVGLMLGAIQAACGIGILVVALVQLPRGKS